MKQLHRTKQRMKLREYFDAGLGALNGFAQHMIQMICRDVNVSNRPTLGDVLILISLVE